MSHEHARRIKNSPDEVVLEHPSRGASLPKRSVRFLVRVETSHRLDSTAFDRFYSFCTVIVSEIGYQAWTS